MPKRNYIVKDQCQKIRHYRPTCWPGLQLPTCSRCIKFTSKLQ